MNSEQPFSLEGYTTRHVKCVVQIVASRGAQAFTSLYSITLSLGIARALEIQTQMR